MTLSDDDETLFAELTDIHNSIRKLRPSDLSDRFAAVGGGGFSDDEDMDDEDEFAHDPPIDVGREMIMIKRPSEVCLGYVGTAKNRVCLDNDDCAIQSHRNSKFKAPFGDESFIMIRGANTKSGAPTGITTPVLKVSDLSQDLIDHVMNLDSSKTDFAATFNLISKGDITTLSDLKGTRELVRSVRKKLKEVKTPAKMEESNKVEDTLARMADLHLTLESALRATSTKESSAKLMEMSATDPKAMNILVTILNNHATGIETIAKRIRNALASVQAHSTLRSKQIKEIHSTSDGLQSIIDQLKGTVGKRSAKDAGLTEHSLWDQASAASSRIMRAEETLAKMKMRIKHLTKTLIYQFKAGALAPMPGDSSTDGSAATALDLEDVVMEEYSQGRGSGRIQNGFLHPPTNNVGFGGQPGGGRSVQFNLGGNNSTAGSASVPGWNGGFASFQQNGSGIGGFNNNQSSNWNGGSGFGGGNNNGNQAPPNNGNAGSGLGGTNGSNGTATDAESLWKELQRINHRLGLLEDDDNDPGSGTTVRFFDHVFRSSDDVASFLEEHLGTGAFVHFSCFVNPNYVLDAIVKYMSPNFKDPKEIKDLKSLRLRQEEFDAYLAADHNQTFPNIFCMPERLQNHSYTTKPNQTSDARFPAIPSPEDFGTQGDGTGLHHALGLAIKHIQTTRLADINRQLRKSPILLALATQMLTVSVTFVSDLFSFMGQTFQALQASFDGHHQAWDCVCASVKDLWESHFLPEKADMASSDLNNQVTFAPLIIWTSLRLTTMAQKLNSTTLASHPTVSSSYIRFLIDHLSNKRTGAMGDIQREIKKLRTELEESNKEIALLKGRLGSVESRTDKLQNKVADNNNKNKGKKKE